MRSERGHEEQLNSPALHRFEPSSGRTAQTTCWVISAKSCLIFHEINIPTSNPSFSLLPKMPSLPVGPRLRWKPKRDDLHCPCLSPREGRRGWRPLHFFVLCYDCSYDDDKLGKNGSDMMWDHIAWPTNIIKYDLEQKKLSHDAWNAEPNVWFILGGTPARFLGKTQDQTISTTKESWIRDTISSTRPSSYPKRHHYWRAKFRKREETA